MTQLIQELVNGLSLGSTYALLALGLAMVFSILGLINFAHGELVTIGGYTMWTLFNHHVPWPAVLVLTLLATTLAAVAMERIAFRPLRGASLVTLLITSFAVSFFIQVSLQIFVSAQPQGIGVPNWTDTVWHVGDVSFPAVKVVTFAVTLAAVLLLTVFLRRTLLGVAMTLFARIADSLAGPKALEHVVDTVLYFEGERHHSHRDQHDERHTYQKELCHRTSPPCCNGKPSGACARCKAAV